jgi:nucleotide-binding universal stress UspA family protein
MWAIKAILVPTDFSKTSALALERASELARSLSSSIVVMHAFQMQTYGAPMMGQIMAPVDLLTSIEEAAQKGLTQLAADLEKSGIAATTILRAGVPWEQILEAAPLVSADLIVMGTHGRRGLTRALIGSVAERVVRLSPIPVLTIRCPDDK